MSFHPNEVARRSRAAAILATAVIFVLCSAFFRTQILGHKQWVLQSEENRLREVPIAAPRGVIFDRNGKIIAENVVGYSVSVLTQSEDSLRATLKKLGGTVPISEGQIERVVRNYKKAPTRPAVILSDASFDVVSVLEEHRVDFPNLIIMSSPKRSYPEGYAVQPFAGYVSEINEKELTQPEFATYKAGQQIGKQGLERQYESVLHGREGSRYVEVDARGRIVREEGAAERKPQQAGSLQTNIDLDLQIYIASLFADSLAGGAVVMKPQTGEVLALYSGPSYDNNRFIGGIPQSYWDSLRADPDNPLYNKALQGKYPPGSTWKLATAVVGLMEGVVDGESRMPQSCNGYYYYGNRAWRCWEKSGHGSLTLTGAIARSCNVYFYQLGLRVGLSRLVAGGVKFGFASKTGIDLPEELRPSFPDGLAYFQRRFGATGWTQGAMALNLSIGQGDNSQTILNMARFYAALANGGSAPQPTIVKRSTPEMTKMFDISAPEYQALKNGMVGVVTAGGTAASAAIPGITLAGKTGTAQTVALGRSSACDHALFAGFAPVDKPEIVVAVILECGAHGYAAARVASAIVGKYFGVVPNFLATTGG